MKRLLLIFLLFLAWEAVQAQDKIITFKHDTIECRITTVSADRIGYEQLSADNQYVGKSISTSVVLKYLRTGEAPRFVGQPAPEEPKRQRPGRRWLFSLQGGLAHSLTDYRESKKYLLSNGNPEATIDDFYSKLSNGVHLNTGLHYLLSNHFGIGAEYNLFHAAAKEQFLARDYGGYNVPIYIRLGIDERIYTHFAGASFLFRQFPGKNKKITISQTIAPGIVLLRNESRNIQLLTYWGDRNFYNGQPPQYYGQANNISSSTTFGAKGSLSVDYAITPHLSAGLAGNFLWGEIKKISFKYALSELEDQELAKAKKISHIDYGFVVRLNF